MAANRIICTTNDVDYIAIRRAMIGGARTVNDLKEKICVCGECEGCKTELPIILSTVCGCEKVSYDAVLAAIKAGADTVEKVGEATKAGTGIDKETGEPCGRCKPLIQNMIDLGR
ncbi:(2Fe-2S)-binding protein [Alkalibacter mobilis]|uniref:(2Fe-2S)-binding protein n=1 Tax=Alkalibacter mobilis TaxID=2787712 RepID=UPI00189E5886|nr:(2Fe-2S)-binding protein [Alkalibacter mobilis]MBF7096808.1 (2Fe-2S)-binding protein [Alkalibacter mobilis]